MELNELNKGDRIELHPATDLWMRGARYGDVTSIGRKHVSVKMDRLRRVIRVSPENILKVITTGTFAGCLITVLLLAGHAEARGLGRVHLSHHNSASTHAHARR